MIIVHTVHYTVRMFVTEPESTGLQTNTRGDVNMASQYEPYEAADRLARGAIRADAGLVTSAGWR